MNFSYVSYISTSGITTLHTQDIFLEKIKNHANNLIGDHIKKARFLNNNCKVYLLRFIDVHCILYSYVGSMIL